MLAGHRLEPSNIAHVPSLEGEGRAAGGRRDRAARSATTRSRRAGATRACARPSAAPSSERASRQAGAIGALPLPGVDMPVLALLQVRLVAELAALHDRPMGAERAVEAAAVVGAGFGWRALGAQRAPLRSRSPRWAAGGTVAYASTRAVGEAALARLQAGHDLIEGRADRRRDAPGGPRRSPSCSRDPTRERRPEQADPGVGRPRRDAGGHPRGRPRGRVLHRAPRPALGGGPRLEGPGRERPRGDGGRLHRGGPREERLPARGRGRRPRRAQAQAPDRRPAEARRRGAGAGDQGRHGQQGRAPDHAALAGRALRGLRALRRGHRRQQAPGRRRAHPPALHLRRPAAGDRRAHRAHRRRRRLGARARARPGLPQAPVGDAAAARRSWPRRRRCSTPRPTSPCA